MHRTMRSLTLMLFLLMALAPSTLASPDPSPIPAGRQSRFLAKVTTKTCNINPSVCQYPTAPPGLQCCGWGCVNTTGDVFNCGKCGKVCKFTQACCDGSCVDINFDKRHCGSCYNKCPKGVLCIYGMCNYA